MIKKQFAYWNEDSNEGYGYYSHYDSLTDAVKEGKSAVDEYEDSDGLVEVFEVTYKSIGKYRLETKPKKVGK